MDAGLKRRAECCAVLHSVVSANQPDGQTPQAIGRAPRVYGASLASARSLIRLYQDLECILPHDQSPGVGGVYAKVAHWCCDDSYMQLNDR